MTEKDIERLEQAARSVFGHDDGDTPVRATSGTESFGDRLRAFLQKRMVPRSTVVPGI